MATQEIIATIRAEIERRFIEYNKDSNHHLQAAEDAELLSLLDTLEESEKPEPFFYCQVGGIMPLCSHCKRNHLNSPYTTEDIDTWYIPHNRGTKQCGEYISIEESEKPIQEGLEEEIERWIHNNADDNGFYNRIDFARHFAKWGAEHLKK